MKKLLRWIFIQLVCVFCLVPFCANKSLCQQLWGMTSDGGSKKKGGNIFSVNADGTGFTERYAFFHDAVSVRNQRLLDYGDGFLYGVGGEFLYRVHPDGSSYEVLYVFQGTPGIYPLVGLMKGNDGYLYGTTVNGGNQYTGVIYKVKKDGTDYQVLHHFEGSVRWPSSLFQFNNGTIFGTTEYGGANDMGTVYRINPDGTNFQMIHHFNGTNGSHPDGGGGLVVVTINAITYLYGTTKYGGTNNKGVIFRIQPNGNNFSRQYNFTQSTGRYPTGSLAKFGNVLYGTTAAGGSSDGGIIFAYDAYTDSYYKLHEFLKGASPVIEYYPLGSLLEYNGMFYGIAVEGGNYVDGVLFRIRYDGSGYQVIHDFNEFYPAGGTLTEFNNQLYGLTNEGYVPTLETSVDGSIYRLNPDGTAFQTLHTFWNPNGYGPTASLIKAQNGSLYGLTAEGGSSVSSGIAFRIQTDGTNFTNLTWMDNLGHRAKSMGSLVQASNGSFYGVTQEGGPGFTGLFFELTDGSSFSFNSYTPFCVGLECSERSRASLIQASDGDFYGTSPLNHFNSGTIFKLSINGAIASHTLLKKFNGTNGANPVGSLIQAPDGYLYGMTEGGGLNGFGVIFKIRTDGTGFQKIFEFGENANALYGAHPKGSLWLGSDGKLYGMAMAGGSGWIGTIFKINTNGQGFSVIHNFNGIDGYYPVGSLVEDVNTGFLFGMTEHGGTSDYGVVFKIKKNGTGFQKLLDFNGTNGKYPKGDLLIVVPGSPPPQKNPLAAAIEKDETKNSLVIDISPNPAKNSIFIRFQKQVSGKITYTLTDIQGRKILQQTFGKAEAASTKTVDISHMPPGTYILELTTPFEKVSKKIVKQ